MTPTFDDVLAAAARIEGHAHRTPVMTLAHARRARSAPQVFFKCENLQRMGAFKFRGAFNALSRFTPAQRARRRGRVLVGQPRAGDRARGAASCGMPATIVMPHDAPAAKVAATRGYGAEVVLYDRSPRTARRSAAALADERGLTLIPPYDHPDVIAGQGTAAQELFEDVGAARRAVRAAGGGGLLSGSRCRRARAGAGVPRHRRRARGGQRRPAVVPPRARSCTSTRPRPSPTARRRSTWARSRFPIIRRDVADDRHRDRRRAGRGACASSRRAHEAGGRADRLPGAGGACAAGRISLRGSASACSSAAATSTSTVTRRCSAVQLTRECQRQHGSRDDHDHRPRRRRDRGLPRPPVDGDDRRSVVVIHHMPGYDAGTKEIVRTFAVRRLRGALPQPAPPVRARREAGDAAAAARAGRDAPTSSASATCRAPIAPPRARPEQPARSASSGTARAVARGSWWRARSTSTPPSTATAAAGHRRAGQARRRPLIELAPQLSCPLLGLFGDDDESRRPTTWRRSGQGARGRRQAARVPLLRRRRSCVLLRRPARLPARRRQATDGQRIWAFFGTHLGA